MRIQSAIPTFKLVILFGAFIGSVSAEEAFLGLDKTEISSTHFGSLLSNRTGSTPDEIPIPGCPNVKFTPLPYDQVTSNIWFNLAHPGTLDPKFEPKKYPPAGTSDDYGRDSIYEAQIISMFIGSLQQTPILWTTIDPPPTEFCVWVNTYIMQSLVLATPSLIDDLRNCLPYNGNPGALMPWLESWTGSIKANAIAGKDLYEEASFKGFAANKMVAVMRSVAAVVSYMRDDSIRDALQKQNRCIKDAWLAWLIKYVVVTKVPVTPEMLSKLYDDWINQLFNDSHTRLLEGLGRMIKWWSEVQGNGLKTVSTNYNSLIDSNAYSAPASTDILANLVGYAM